MRNFGRALRFVWSYRMRLALSWLCAGLVGVLWAANISAVYPVVVVLFEGGSLHDWVDRQVHETETDVAELQAALSGRLAEREREVKQSELESARRARARYLWLAPIVKRWAPAGPFQALQWLLLLLMVAILIKGIFLFLQEWLVASVTQRSLFDLRNRFYQQTLELDVAQFSADGTAELMSRFTYDMDSLSSGFKTLLGKVVREPLKALCCVVAACLISWQLTLLSAVIAPVAGWAILHVARILKRASRRSMESMSRVYKILEETFAGIKIVKAFTMEPVERERFRAEARRYRRHAMKIAKVEAFSGPLTEFMGVGLIVIALWAGAYLLLGNGNGTHLFGVRMASRPMDKGSLVTLYALLAGISDPARKLSNVLGRLQRAAAASDRIFAFLDRRPQVVSSANGIPLARHSKSLELANVHFAYEPGKPVLRGVELCIPFRESVALVGPNGSGKSTLANLVLRFYDPTEGALLLDGTDLRKVSLEAYRGQIGIVTQETVLFDDTVYNNISYGCRDATPSQVYAAARRAHADRFIEQLSEGYQTRVGEKGMLLSGGQRQRIALARAILRDPAILILDEATSALDLESEHLIHRALEEFIRHRTTIIITHRLSTLALAQRIVVLDAGQIVAVGTHGELVQSCSLYRRLHELQFKQDPASSAPILSGPHHSEAQKPTRTRNPASTA